MEEATFYADWLKHRYPYDSEARNKLLEANVLAYLAPKQQVTLVDVGAGTGSNALYLMDKIKGDQHWYFIEQNEEFQQFLTQRLQEYASYHKYEFQSQDGIQQIISPKKQLSFQFIKGSLLDIQQLLPLKKVDIILANAVFDLFTKEQIQDFLSPLLSPAVACYFTLNYQSMGYHPEEPFDLPYIHLYEQHMERPQQRGRATGKAASTCIEEILANTHTIQKERSVWDIQQEDIKMHYYLLSFMENAIPELEIEAELSKFFPKWIQRKRELVISRQLALEVRHWDLFCIPSPNS